MGNRIGQRFEGLNYSPPPGAIFTYDQNLHEATPEQKRQNRRIAITAGEIIISSIFTCGLPPVGAVLGLIFIGENIIRYRKLE